jgi:LAS superfamily LD-carboxypeptidase LdcB
VSLSMQQREILGLETAHLCDVNSHYLQPLVHRAYAELAAEAEKAGFRLAIASAHRSFERQLRIWNGKLCGERAVFDDQDRPVDLRCLDPQECLHAVLRFSALPGTSRHHWGSDLDVYDAAAVPMDYRVQLSAAEVEGEGVFAPLHDWLDERISAGQSFGFYRPYDRDRGGVAPERWHLSYAPIASLCSQRLDARCLREAWAEASLTQAFLSLELVEAQLDALLERYVERVAKAPPAALTYSPAS